MRQEHSRQKHSARKHPSPERLIDFADGEVAGADGREMDEHLASCEKCRAYVDSLKRTFALAGQERVPEQSAAYWNGFEADVRRRVRSRKAVGKWAWSGKGQSVARWSSGRRWRLALVLSPGLAVALALAFALTRPQAPPYLASDLEPPLEDMTVGEIARTMSGDAVFTDMVIEAADEDISSIEQYLLETGDLGDLIEGLADDEAHDLASTIADEMRQKGTQIIPKDGRDRLS